MNRKKVRQEKGITLIALVITIIVILILVAVTITVAVNGGLFNYARKARVDTNTRITEERDFANIPSGWTYENLIDKYTSDSNKDKNEEEKYISITSGYNFGWQQGFLDSSNGNIKYNGGQTLNNYLSGLLYFDKIEINIFNNLLIKIAYYDENGNFISADPWKSKEETNWSSGGTEQIVLENKYVRICIADTTVNNSNDYTLTATELESRFTYEISNSRNTIKRIVLLPDVENGNEGRGFTCTGLTYDDTEQCFYVGNYGKMLPTDTTTYNTIVKLSKDGKNVLGEIKLYDKIPEITKDIQGVTVDSSDNSLWVAACEDGKIFHISKNGTLLGNISYTKPSGLAYDKSTDTLWVLNYYNNGGNIKNITKTGEEKKSIEFTGINDADQIYLDSTNDIIYFTAGANYNSSNYVYKVDLKTEEVTLFKILNDSYAVEGIWIINDWLYIMNDGYYHSAKFNQNYIMIYNLKE